MDSRKVMGMSGSINKPSVTTLQEPYVGPEPYSQKQAFLFFGRRQETEDLSALIQAENAVLLYAASGAGKTSLLNAGVLPLLEQVGAYVTRPGRIASSPLTARELQQVDNVFVYSLIRNWELNPTDATAEQLGKITLAQYLSQYWPQNPDSASAGDDSNGANGIRVVVIDQFEELFTQYQEHWKHREKFCDQIFDILEGSPVLLRPGDIRNYTEIARRWKQAISGTTDVSDLDRYCAERFAGNLRQLLAGWEPEKRVRSQLRLEILRTLNDLIRNNLLYQPRTPQLSAPLDSELRDYAEQQRQNPATGNLTRIQRCLLTQIFPEAISPMCDGDPRLRLILSVKEEFLGAIDSYAPRLPGRLRVRMRLEPLREKQALQAVTEPLKFVSGTRSVKYAENAAEVLVQELLVYDLPTLDDLWREFSIWQSALASLTAVNKTIWLSALWWMKQLSKWLQHISPQDIYNRRGKDDDEVAGEINEPRVAREFVEALHLQIVCQNVWNQLPPQVSEITPEHVKKHGNVERALEDFYELRLRKIVAETRNLREDELRSWFAKHLITPMNTRGIIYRGDTDTLGISNRVVDKLEQARLIRAEPRGQTIWYELAHDRFIPSIKHSNDVYRIRRKLKMIQIWTTLATMIFWGCVLVVLYYKITDNNKINNKISNKISNKPVGDYKSDANKLADDLNNARIMLNEPVSERQQQAIQDIIKVLDASQKLSIDKHDTPAGQTSDDVSKPELKDLALTASALLNLALTHNEALRPYPEQIADFKMAAPITAIALSPDHTMVAAGNRRGDVSVWDTDTHNLLMSTKLYSAVTAIAFSKESLSKKGSIMTCVSRKGTLLVLNPKTGKNVLKIAASKALWSVCVSQDGRYIAYGGAGLHHYVIDLRPTASNRNPITTSPNYPVLPKVDGIMGGTAELIRFLNFSANAKYLAAAYGNKALIWDMSTYRLVKTFPHDEKVIWAGFGVGNSSLPPLKTASRNGARLWDSVSGTSNTFLNPEHSPNDDTKVLDCRFSPDGSLISPLTVGGSHFLATVSLDGEAWLWNGDTAKKIDSLADTRRSSNRQVAISVAFSNDGKYLAVGTKQGHVVVYLWRSEDLTDQIKKKFREKQQ